MKKQTYRNIGIIFLTLTGGLLITSFGKPTTLENRIALGIVLIPAIIFQLLAYFKVEENQSEQ